jgi:hypothetical protein
MSRIAGDFDYEAHGGGYAGLRRTDARIAAQLCLSPTAHSMLRWLP